MMLVELGRRESWKIAAVWLSALCLLLAAASHGRPVPAGNGTRQTGSRFAIADFDGDNRPDLATVQVGQIGASDARYWIKFELSAGAKQQINVAAPVGGLEIAPRDVNGDANVDLVVTTAWLAHPVAVLLNDGHGNFTYRDAQAFAGTPWRGDTGWFGGKVDGKDAVAWTQTGSADQHRARPPIGRIRRVKISVEPHSHAVKKTCLVACERAPPASGFSA